MKHLKLYHINSYKNLLESEAATKVFCNKTLLKNFAKVTRKHLCQSLFLNKVADLRPC